MNDTQLLIRLVCFVSKVIAMEDTRTMVSDRREGVVLCFAVFTRFLTIALQVFANNLIPDHEADAFRPEWGTHKFGDHAIQVLFGGFQHWDAAHFLYIAEHGYTTEETFAFFPLYPMLLSSTKEQMASKQLLSVMSMHSAILVSAVFTNLVFFALAAVLLYTLGCTVLKDESLAFKAALLFCINPAGIFMTAAYTESMFAAASFLAMFLLEKNYTITAAAAFAVATATRSNGTVSCGFILYFFVKDTFANLVMVSRTKRPNLFIASVLRILMKGLVCLLSLLFIVSPFLMFQYYAYIKFCTDEKFFGLFEVARPLSVIENDDIDFKETDDFPDVTPSFIFGETPWCNNTPPLVYSYIQEKYWNVGLFQYYQLKQIPNFLLALPMIILGCTAVFKYCSVKWNFVKYLGLMPRKVKQDDETSEDRDGFYSDSVFVYMVHMAALLMFGVLFMNVQVVTRFIASSCPVIYWFAAAMTTPASVNHLEATNENQGNITSQSLLNYATSNGVTRQIVNFTENDRRAQLILAYFLIYNLLGIILHCNFLPWT